jgi:hypothetical protein
VENEINIHTINVIKTDVLLWNLRSFAEISSMVQYSDALPNKLIKEIMILSKKSKGTRGIYSSLAEKYGRSVNAIKIHVSRARSGKIPQYWNAV